MNYQRSGIEGSGADEPENLVEGAVTSDSYSHVRDAAAHSDRVVLLERLLSEAVALLCVPFDDGSGSTWDERRRALLAACHDAVVGLPDPVAGGW